MPEYIQTIRQQVGHQRLLVPSTACIVLNGDEEVLLELRSDNECWGLPGGIMDIGETALESARREIAEETGLRADDLWLFGVYSGENYKGRYANGDEIAVVQLAFVAERFIGEPQAGSESRELGFFRFDALPSPLTPHHQEFLMHFSEYLTGRRTVPVVQ
ncbi:MAG TPA: NUDIX domain-containing protein [Candidatus Kapabacteria bacterium]|nr:NUDIX domain-containing protein [Candidatus Kapabacteria bacterium]